MLAGDAEVTRDLQARAFEFLLNQFRTGESGGFLAYPAARVEADSSRSQAKAILTERDQHLKQAIEDRRVAVEDRRDLRARKLYEDLGRLYQERDQNRDQRSPVLEKKISLVLGQLRAAQHDDALSWEKSARRRSLPVDRGFHLLEEIDTALLDLEASPTTN
jgi:hypothetical protein